MEEVGMKVLVVYYSMYGHVIELAQAAVDGIKEVAGVEAVLRGSRNLRRSRKRLTGTSMPGRRGKERAAMAITTALSPARMRSFGELTKKS
jgi:hypothetical protein